MAKHAQIIVQNFNESGILPFEVVWKPTLIDSTSIRRTFEEANADEECAGVITWMHTFSPAKSWIAGLQAFKKPLLHLHTQFNEEIPYDTIDMDFMNENQSAHGDREFGHIVTRMGIPREVVVGYYESKEVKEKIASWMRSAIGMVESKNIRVVRIADNMRNVAVTEGDKVEAQIKFGWEIDAYPVNEVVDYVNAVSKGDIDALTQLYYEKYNLLLEGRDPIEFKKHVEVQAGIEIGLEKFLKDHDYQAVVTHFGDLGGLKQLPGLAIQRLMEKGYGFVFMGVNAGTGKGALNYSLEFKGGTSTNVTFDKAYTLKEIDETMIPDLEKVTDNPNIQVRTVANSNQVIFKTQTLDLEKREAFAKYMADKFGVEEKDITTENISSTVSSEMRVDAIIAVAIATVFMLLYIWLRFKDIRFATSAVVALIHDVLVVLAFYVIARISVGNTFIACMLTIVGYSINATIVIFDRIREEIEDKETWRRVGCPGQQMYHKNSDKKYLYISDNICYGGGTVYYGCKLH